MLPEDVLSESTSDESATSARKTPKGSKTDRPPFPDSLITTAGTYADCYLNAAETRWTAEDADEGVLGPSPRRQQMWAVPSPTPPAKALVPA